MREKKNLLKVDNLSVSYDGKTEVLKDINLSLEEGSVLAIIGESGSGKTTLARALLDTLPLNAKVTSGTIVYKDLELLGLSKKEYLKLYGKEISAIFQNPSSYLNPIIKIEKQFVEMLCSNLKIDEQKAIEVAIKMLKKVNLNNTKKVLNSYAFELSGGMLQRVMIAMVFSLNPSLIIADEPTSALDVFTQKQVLDELIKLKNDKNISMIIITHSFSVASYVADFITVVFKGSIVEYGRKDEILKHPKHPHTKELLSSAIYIQKSD